MEQYIETFEFNGFSFLLYDNYFVYKTKKQEYLLAYSEIKTIEKKNLSINYARVVDIIILFSPIEKYAARFPIKFRLGQSQRKELAQFYDLMDALLCKKVECIESGMNGYPEIVKKDREKNIEKKPFGTNGWGKLRCYHEDIWAMLVCLPPICIVFAIWYNVCKKYIYY